MSRTVDGPQRPRSDNPPDNPTLWAGKAIYRLVEVQMARPAKIPRNLHGALRELDLEGRTSTQIVEWLLDNYQICVTDETVLRVLRRVRVVPPVDGEGPTDLLARSARRCEPTCWPATGVKSTAPRGCSSRSTRSYRASVARPRPAWLR